MSWIFSLIPSLFSWRSVQIYKNYLVLIEKYLSYNMWTKIEIDEVEDKFYVKYPKIEKKTK